VRILLFGMTGQVGWELQRSLAPLGELVALGRSSPIAADFMQPMKLEGTVRAVRPQVIVNAAAYTAVDEAETHPDVARTINATAPAHLASAAAAVGAWLVHYSTDHVFDGGGDAPWNEDSPTGPLNVYGQTKIESEIAVRSSGCRHVILRTSWIHAARGNNFVRKIMRQASECDSLEVVADQFGSPTGADLVADITAHVLRGVLAQPALAGTYHVAAAGETSWHAYAQHVVELARANGLSLRLRPAGLIPISSRAYQGAARRPYNSRLNTRKLRETFNLVLPDWRLGVERTLKEALS
jgi:dTDP-4-dehydrorhamnose reductase